jgi:hypothetical protein
MTLATQLPTGNATAVGTWTNGATGLNLDDGTNASFTTTTKNDVRSLTVGTFGFDGAIPSGSTINSVAIEVQEQLTSGGTLRSVIIVGGVDGTLNDNTTDTALTVRTYSALTRPGGGSWTRADLLDGTLTARFEGRQPNNTTSRTYQADYLKVIVDYTAFTNYTQTETNNEGITDATAQVSAVIQTATNAEGLTDSLTRAATIVRIISPN